MELAIACAYKAHAQSVAATKPDKDRHGTCQGCEKDPPARKLNEPDHETQHCAKSCCTVEREHAQLDVFHLSDDLKGNNKSRKNEGNPVLFPKQVLN